MKVDATAGKNVVDSFKGDSMDIGKYIVEFAFGDIYDRGILDFKQREIITLSSLVSIGDTSPQLAVHIHAALNVGMTQKEIIEIFIHLIPYVGFPRVLNAVNLANSIFEENDNGD